ncbi:MAG: FecR domain-containing protein [Acidobacteriaceae bacterium]|nr:FecR domain-containing protein [Acidobacteriaceae bacterium]
MRTLSWAVWVGALGAALVEGQTTSLDGSMARPFEAHATAVSGQVTRIRDEQPWAMSNGERVPVRQVITTGADGYAHFEVAGGSSFDIFGNSKVVFRQNAVAPEDLLDVVGGRVRIHLQPTIGQLLLRVFCPVAVISTHQPATIAVAVDEDETARIDVIEGEVGIQHRLLPRNEAVLVRAVDAVVVRRDEPMSRRVERGSLYRYTVKILSAVTFGHSGTHSAEPVEEGKFLARAVAGHMHQAF